MIFRRTAVATYHAFVSTAAAACAACAGSAGYSAVKVHSRLALLP